MTVERDFYPTITAAAEALGWLVYHTHDSRRSQKGFPDFVLARERVVYAEIKGAKTPVTGEQQEWIDRLTAAGAEAYVWRMPADMDVLLETLRARRPTVRSAA